MMVNTPLLLTAETYAASKLLLMVLAVLKVLADNFSVPAAVLLSSLSLPTGILKLNCSCGVPLVKARPCSRLQRLAEHSLLKFQLATSPFIDAGHNAAKHT